MMIAQAIGSLLVSSNPIDSVTQVSYRLHWVGQSLWWRLLSLHQQLINVPRHTYPDSQVKTVCER